MNRPRHLDPLAERVLSLLSARPEALFAGWKHVFDRFPVVTSPAYHAVRLWFQWEPA